MDNILMCKIVEIECDDWIQRWDSVLKAFVLVYYIYVLCYISEHGRYYC